MVKIGRAIVGVLVVILVGSIGVFCRVHTDDSANAAMSNLAMSATIEPSMTMTLSDTSKVIDVKPTSEGTFGATSVNVGVVSNGSIGFTLTMTPSSTSLVGTSGTIPTLSATSSCSGNSFSCSSNNGFGAGRWGVAINNDFYRPAAEIVLANVSNPSTGAIALSNTIHFGVNLDLTSAVDSYSTAIAFVAVPITMNYKASFVFDSGIDSVVVKSLDGASVVATISSSGDFVELDYANSYIIAPNYATGQGLDSMSLTGGGTLVGNILTMGTTSTTVEVSSKNTTAPIKSIEDVNYMQQFASMTPTELANVKSSMTLNTQYQLMDNRDDKAYYIAKLADGNVWMTQNLDHYIVSTPNFYTYYNTDIGHGDIVDTTATWTGVATRTTSDATWNSSNTLPESYNPGSVCWDGILDDHGAGLNERTQSCREGVASHDSIGIYYNWTAAAALSNSAGYIKSIDIDQSICPAGWRLPTYEGDKSYQNLVDAIRVRRPNSVIPYDAPLYLAYGGGWRGSSRFVGYNGQYWTAMVVDEGNGVSENAYQFVAYYVNNTNYQATEERSTGSSVRCVAR